MSIAQQIATLRDAPTKVLVEHYVDLFGHEPRFRHPRWLFKKVAWKLQEREHGGLSKTAKRRLDELIVEVGRPFDEAARTITAPLHGRTKPGGLALGTTLVREWHDQEIRVCVVEGGFEHDGIVYRSLSAVAKAITGAHWSGMLFFGLRKRKKAT